LIKITNEKTIRKKEKHFEFEPNSLTISQYENNFSDYSSNSLDA
jgi:hypothetical protein